MPVHFYSEDSRFPSSLKKRITAVWLTDCIKHEGYDCGEISIIACSDEHLLEINRQYLKHNYYTDIITFNYNENHIINGDLFLSTERIKENAKLFNVTAMHELHRVMVHGVLHLCGYNDHTDQEKKIIRDKENHYLELLYSKE